MIQSTPRGPSKTYFCTPFRDLRDRKIHPIAVVLRSVDSCKHPTMEPGAKGSFAVQDLTFLARSIRRAAVYYERAMLEAPNKTRSATFGIWQNCLATFFKGPDHGR